MLHGSGSELERLSSYRKGRLAVVQHGMQLRSQDSSSSNRMDKQEIIKAAIIPCPSLIEHIGRPVAVDF